MAIHINFVLIGLSLCKNFGKNYRKFKEMLEFFVKQVKINVKQRSAIPEEIKNEITENEAEKKYPGFKKEMRHFSKFSVRIRFHAQGHFASPKSAFIIYDNYKHDVSWNIKISSDKNYEDGDILNLNCWYTGHQRESSDKIIPHMKKFSTPKTFAVKDLGLFDNQRPNKKIIELYFKFEEMIKFARKLEK